MKAEIAAMLTAKDEKYACALADKIISESQETDEWYEYFDDFASLLDHPKSLVRNRVICILAANADLSKYKDSMRPLIEKDILETENKLKEACR